MIYGKYIVESYWQGQLRCQYVVWADSAPQAREKAVEMYGGTGHYVAYKAEQPGDVM